MASIEPSKLWKRAIVIGGSIAGKLAAKVLSEFFQEVIIIEKDKKREFPDLRAGVPQGSQGHALLKSGEEILEDLFPGFIEELIRYGAVTSNFSNDLSWYHHGSWKVQHQSGMETIQQSRPFLEYHLQRRLEEVPTIKYIYGANVKRILTNLEATQIIGVDYQTENGSCKSLNSDLVVDAAGAATLTPNFLKANGYLLNKTEVKVNLFYASRIYDSLSPTAKLDKGLLVYPNPPTQARGGGMYQIEENKWMVTLLGYGVKPPPIDTEQFLNYAASLDYPTIFDAIKDGKPGSNISIYRFPALRRYHYEKMKRFPEGLIVIGDALCRIDPVFAQGMSLAALEAKELQKVLHKFNKTKKPSGISQQVHRSFHQILAIPWLIATIEDFRFTHTQGKKIAGLSVMQAYIKKVMEASSTNPDVYEKFIHVMHLKTHPVTLFSPAMLKSIFFNRQIKKHRKKSIRT